MSRNKSITLWIIWILTFPTLMIYLYYMLEPSFHGYWIDLIAFAIVMCAVAIFPIIVGSTTIFFVNGVSFAAFLYFGLYAEIILTQLALAALFIKIRLKKEDFYRIAMNSTMFLLTSIFSAAAYYALGGTHGVLDLNTTSEILPLVGYIATALIVNQILLLVIDAFIKGRFRLSIVKSIAVDVSTTLLIFPLGVILYILYLEIGIAGVFIVGFPSILLSLVISSYHKGRRVNAYLHETSNIGHELSKKLNVKSVLDTFISEVEKLIPHSYILVYDVTGASKVMNIIRYVNTDKLSEKHEQIVHYGEGFAGGIYKSKEARVISKRKEFGEEEPFDLPNDVQSVIGVPILRNDNVVGILVIASKKIRAFEKYHLVLLEILGNFLSVAIENARHYQSEKNKNLKDQLTGLYNYRHIIEHIEGYAIDLEEKGISERLSIILFDLDSFKNLNDTYGHEAGNEVLIELAKRIENYIGTRGTVARYGGEEFTVLIKDISHEDALEVAEDVRNLVAKDPFKLTNHLKKDQLGEVEVAVTISVGVATYPDHCETPGELIRQADRAMYVGAKRNGKNKVASIAM